MLLHDAAEAEDLSVGGGDALFEVALGGAPGGAFVAELGREHVHDAAIGGHGRGRLGGREACCVRSVSMRRRNSELA